MTFKVGINKYTSRRWIIFLVLIVGFICVLLVLVITRESKERAAFAQRICDNLVQAHYIAAENCYSSETVPEVMNRHFTNGVSLAQVLISMAGFEKISDYIGIIDTCNDYRVIEFEIIHGSFGWNKYLLFTFCDGVLINTTWEN